jgi:large subunit ribosomal protein L2
MRNFKISVRSASGRNSKGRLTAHRKGGGLKKIYKIINFSCGLYNIPGIVRSIEYDSFRSSFVSLILYKNGLLTYILSVKGLNVGDIIFSSNNSFIYKNGDTLPLKFIQIGTFVHNIELYVGAGGVLIRAAGSSAKILRQTEFFTILRLRSGEERLFVNGCKATVGVLSNGGHKLVKFFKAGIMRNLGIRPTVRGIAMNPVDHPNGGRSKGGRPFTDRWGNLSKGGRLYKNKLYNKFIVKARFN